MAWASAWQLHINIEKCCVLPLGNHAIHSSIPNYSINGIILNANSNVSDLGVKIDNDLSFKSHIATITSKGLQRVGILFRGFATRSLPILRKAFITYIRPILEYNSSIWNPCLKMHIDAIENVQRRFTKRIPSLSSLPYLERLAILDLEPLELRRLRVDLTMYYKIINGLTPLEGAAYFTYYSPIASSRTDSKTLNKPSKGSCKLFNSFFYRAIDCWNSLPFSCRDSASLSLFKSQLTVANCSTFLLGNYLEST